MSQIPIYFHLLDS